MIRHVNEALARGVFLLMLATSACPALAAVAMPDGYRMEDYRGPVPDSVPGASIVHAPQVEDLIEQDGAVLIDVLAAPRRPPGMRQGTPWLPEPHEDLPGSLWWPGVGRGAISAELEARFRQRLGEVVEANPGSLVVFYCLSNCWLSWNAAKRAASYGIPAAWFPDGADGWKAAGLPVEKATPEFLDQPPDAP